MTDQLDCVVVGAGVIGLAVGRSLAMAGREVVVLESEPDIGMHTSSRNSEVIHAGIYYGEGTLKARLCVQGKEMLYRYCEERHVPFQRIGKLIVASCDAEVGRLQQICKQAAINGVSDLELIDDVGVRRLEPSVDCKRGLLSPSTGIIDSHSLMLSLQADIESYGGTVLTHNRVSQASVVENGFRLKVDETAESLDCRILINSAGLRAADFANSIDGFDSDCVAKVRFAKAHYFAYQGKSPFRHLVYPLPTDGGLGVHATNDVGGSARFGPDVDWVDEIDYSFDESRKQRFVDAIGSYFPGLDEARLVPAYTGIRPKLSGPGKPAADFLIQGEAAHGVMNLVNLFGIESPGLTASLAIGKYVNDLLG